MDMSQPDGGVWRSQRSFLHLSQAFSQTDLFIGGHPLAVIAHCDADIAILNAALDLDQGGIARLFAEPMLEAVFEQGLKRHFGYELVQRIWMEAHVHVDMRIKRADLGDIHIIFQMPDFLLQRHDVLRLKAVGKQSSELLAHDAGGFGAVDDRLAGDGLQGII